MRERLSKMHPLATRADDFYFVVGDVVDRFVRPKARKAAAAEQFRLKLMIYGPGEIGADDGGGVRANDRRRPDE